MMGQLSFGGAGIFFYGNVSAKIEVSLEGTKWRRFRYFSFISVVIRPSMVPVRMSFRILFFFTLFVGAGKKDNPSLPPASIPAPGGVCNDDSW